MFHRATIVLTIWRHRLWQFYSTDRSRVCRREPAHRPHIQRIHNPSLHIDHLVAFGRTEQTTWTPPWAALHRN